MNQPTTLFLHGGPGLSAIVERELYGNSLDIHWWDQPHFEVLFAKPYQALLDDTLLQARRLAGQGKVNLLAHSFGARIALDLATRMPTCIGTVTLLAPTFDVAEALARLAEHLAPTAPNPARLLSVAHRAKRPGTSFADVWTLVEAIRDVPDFLSAYWGAGSEERRLWFYDVIATKPWVDFNTCKVILEDFWKTPTLNIQTVVTGPVTLVLGTQDVLVDAPTAEHAWRRYFPRATTRLLNAGHFMHLEKLPSEWLPSN
ncbi:alpha/beta hydrolase [Burkholderia sp.]|uniref:alpha/beta fold hydrolase n=1 Tax=Burkholderia sp. TaxID=36773 RepID=UPI0025C17A41|nr:alpha/beta hydrolase [Burkholderia sp.]MBS6363149.1 alpha/beta hydrolase [Burkholderia sp.]